MMTPLENAIDLLTGQIGQEVGVSDWFDMPQTRINQFADVTEDHQFIHIDPVRAAQETPFDGTIAHGFLTLSLASAMAYQVLAPLEGRTASINYGFDKIRFIAPVPAGSRLRGRFILLDATARSERELLLKHAFSIEIDQLDKPALAAEWISLTLF